MTKKMESSGKKFIQLAVDLCKNVSRSYCIWVVQNPEKTTTLETFVKVLGYIIPVRFGAQQGFTELIYAMTNFLSFFNDRIMANTFNVKSREESHPKIVRRLTFILSMIDILEVPLELLVESKISEPAKWFTVLAVLLFKTIVKFWLVYKMDYGLVTCPTIPPLDRKNLVLKGKEREAPASTQVWRGPRTGHFIRSIHGDPVVPYHDLRLGNEALSEGLSDGLLGSTKLEKVELIGEGLFIARPLVHILTMFVTGQNSWKSWLIALGMDLTSAYIMGNSSHLKKSQNKEVMRRKCILLLYLLRSPFYDKITKNIIYSLFQILGKIPLAHIITDPFIEYLPRWQETYFYNWLS